MANSASKKSVADKGSTIPTPSSAKKTADDVGKSTSSKELLLMSIMRQIEVDNKEIDFDRVAHDIDSVSAGSARKRWTNLYKELKSTVSDDGEPGIITPKPTTRKIQRKGKQGAKNGAHENDDERGMQLSGKKRKSPHEEEVNPDEGVNGEGHAEEEDEVAQTPTSAKKAKPTKIATSAKGKGKGKQVKSVEVVNGEDSAEEVDLQTPLKAKNTPAKKTKSATNGKGKMTAKGKAKENSVENGGAEDEDSADDMIVVQNSPKVMTTTVSKATAKARGSGMGRGNGKKPVVQIPVKDIEGSSGDGMVGEKQAINSSSEKQGTKGEGRKGQAKEGPEVHDKAEDDAAAEEENQVAALVVTPALEDSEGSEILESVESLEEDINEDGMVVLEADQLAPQDDVMVEVAEVMV